LDLETLKFGFRNPSPVLGFGFRVSGIAFWVLDEGLEAEEKLHPQTQTLNCTLKPKP